MPTATNPGFNDRLAVENSSEVSFTVRLLCTYVKANYNSSKGVTIEQHE